jgi:hypothetical protein
LKPQHHKSLDWFGAWRTELKTIPAISKRNRQLTFIRLQAISPGVSLLSSSD